MKYNSMYIFLYLEIDIIGVSSTSKTVSMTLTEINSMFSNWIPYEIDLFYVYFSF